MVGGSVAKRLVEDNARKARGSTMSPTYRSHLDERGSSDLAPRGFQDNWVDGDTDGWLSAGNEHSGLLGEMKALFLSSSPQTSHAGSCWPQAGR